VCRLACEAGSVASILTITTTTTTTTSTTTTTRLGSPVRTGTQQLLRQYLEPDLAAKHSRTDALHGPDGTLYYAASTGDAALVRRLLFKGHDVSFAIMPPMLVGKVF
jgi:hypothetical protein